jgi:hypothetical protein
MRNLQPYRALKESDCSSLKFTAKRDCFAGNMAAKMVK